MTAILLMSAALLGCVNADVTAEPVPNPDKPEPSSSSGAADVITEAITDVDPRSTILLIEDPATLIALERDHGLGLAALLHGGPAEATADYGAGPLQAIERSMAARLKSDRADDPIHTGVGLRHVHRQFDLAWLSSPDTRFELIGVVNRMDRQVFAPDSVGETRLIYRLAYTRTQQGMVIDSRLPMTINVVYFQRGPELRTVQERWRPEPGLAGAELAAWLRESGRALAVEQLDAGALKSVEIDVQTERWPSTIRPDMAGHAEYLLQVFRQGPSGWQPTPLENTPDVARLDRDPKLRAALLEWLRDPAQRDALDRGTLVVPEQYLATAATSVTPRGFARLGNRPWSQLFRADEFATLELDGLQTTRSPAALLRRLDGLSCQGCHESRSIAGFHLLGVERDPDRRVDALAVSSSPHLAGELDRRRAWHDAITRGEPATDARPLSEHERHRGAWGSHCGLGDPGFAAWTCEAGLVCTKLGDPDLGTCLEPGPGLAGGVCEVGEIKPKSDFHRDRVTNVEPRTCADGGVCDDNRVGFPEGMCAFACGSSAAGPDSACGAIPNLRSFNDCLAAKRPFTQCIADTANPAGMRSCGVEAACRDDYICARSSSDAGVCLPPYFLFQLRVDGHPA